MHHDGYLFTKKSLSMFSTQANECPARITLTKKEDKWYITHVNEKHSHDLSPTKSRLFRGIRMMNLRVKRCIDLNVEAGVRTNKTYQSLVHAAGGYDNILFVERDVRNYISQQRRALGKEGDDQALLKHFSRMRELNKNIFFDIDMDEHNRIRNVFWADARSRAASQYFGDVVSFDTAYLTNKYDMPFAPFVGVNHHRQSILLGCGLLSSEETNTFVWLFECWLHCIITKLHKDCNRSMSGYEHCHCDHVPTDTTQVVFVAHNEENSRKVTRVCPIQGHEANHEGGCL